MLKGEKEFEEELEEKSSFIKNSIFKYNNSLQRI